MYCKYNMDGWCELREKGCDPTDGECIAQQAIQKRKKENGEGKDGYKEDNCGRTEVNPD